MYRRHSLARIRPLADLTTRATSAPCLMTLRPSFIEQPALGCLRPWWESYVRAGLNAYVAGVESPAASAHEIYTTQVFERVSELDNSINSVRLAMSLLMNLTHSHENAAETYRYHYENLIFRLTGIDDRAHRLVGAAIGMPPRDLEKNGGNKRVVERIQASEPDVYQRLAEISRLVQAHKSVRNKVAHAEAFSNREIGLFLAISSLKLDTGDMGDVHSLMDAYFSREACGFAPLIAGLVEAIEALIAELKPIFERVASVQLSPDHDGTHPNPG